MKKLKTAKPPKGIYLLALALMITTLSVGLALANGTFELPRHVLSGGASGVTTTDNVNVHATLGQPVVGAISSGDVTLGQGYWHGGYFPDGGIDIYLPLIQR